MVSTRVLYFSLVLGAVSLGLGVVVFQLIEPIETIADLAWMFGAIGVLGFALGIVSTLVILRLQRQEKRDP